MKTYMAKAETVERKWYVIDAEGKTLGRMSSEIAKVLRGKNKPVFTPHVDTGDYVIVINAEKVYLSGKKLEQKMYRHHTLFPGGLKEVKYKHFMEKTPEKAIEIAVKRMLPKNTLGRKTFKKLFVYKGSEHPHAAQNPEALELNI